MHDKQVQVVETVLLDEEIDDSAKDQIDVGLGVKPAQQIGQPGSGVLDVTRGESDEQRVLVREVLVERPHRDIGIVGNVIGGGRGAPLLVENASRSIEDPLDRATGTFLTWSLARRRR